MPGPIRDPQFRPTPQVNTDPTETSSSSSELRAKLAEMVEPGETLELVNISADPESAMNRDSMEVNSDDWSRFTEKTLGIQEGDHLRVRTRDAQGNASNWISLQATGLSDIDTRNAQVMTDAIGLETNEQGEVELIYLGDGELSEPNAKVRFTNQRTNQTFDFQLDAEGKLPEGLVFQGKPGDSMSVAVSDGVNNVDFAEVAGVSTIEGPPPPIDLVDPAPWKKRHVDDDGNPTITTQRYSGPLFVDGVSASDTKQGSLANCYFTAAASAVANTHPEIIEDMIKDNGNGTYTVTFKEETYYRSGRFRNRKVTVDGDLYKRSYGDQPMYGGSIGSESAPDKMEMWYPILEKAYANLKGNSYDAIGNGGSAEAAMNILIGGRSRSHSLTPSNADYAFEKITEAVEKGWPVTASTYGKDADEAERYSGEKIYPWHVYTVMGVAEENGTKFVQLRNPWGNTEPGSDGKDDGIFRLELEKFVHFYKTTSISRPVS